jgi:hypothetical protein
VNDDELWTDDDDDDDGDERPDWLDSFLPEADRAAIATEVSACGGPASIEVAGRGLHHTDDDGDPYWAGSPAWIAGLDGLIAYEKTHQPINEVGRVSCTPAPRK